MPPEQQRKETGTGEAGNDTPSLRIVSEQPVSEYDADKIITAKMILSSKTKGNIARLATRIDSPLLITGSMGTGKTTLARIIHKISRRRNQPFVEVNASALGNGNLHCSALFGHEKGSFTGAANKRPGLLREADGGILFLDEVATMPLEIQAALFPKFPKQAPP